MKKVTKEVKNTNKAPILFLTFCLLAIVGLISALVIFSKDSKSKSNPNSISENVKDLGGEQIVSLSAKEGFTPSSTILMSGKPSKLKVSTNNTYDCSSVVNIPKLGISKTLASTGETEIEIPAQISGTVITGTCSLGKYHFSLTYL